jgi:competence protein ComEA
MLSRTLATLAALVLISPPLLAAPQSAPRPDAAKPSLIVNINTAGATELQQLPGVGERTAARIVEYRQKNGPFKKIEELMNVQGIGEKSFLKLRTQLTVESRPASGAPQPQ